MRPVKPDCDSPANLRAKIKSALTYPVIVIAFSMLMLMVVLIFIVLFMPRGLLGFRRLADIRSWRATG